LHGEIIILLLDALTSAAETRCPLVGLRRWRDHWLVTLSPRTQSHEQTIVVIVTTFLLILFFQRISLVKEVHLQLL
jgi:hypothetical protein